eukprot:SAG31_NODE_2299_length_5981_cov_2.649439_6_plen_471_part_00
MRGRPVTSDWARASTIFDPHGAERPLVDEQSTRTGQLSLQRGAHGDQTVAKRWLADRSLRQGSPPAISIALLLERPSPIIADQDCFPFDQWHLGSGNQNGTGIAPIPSAYGINESCTFNSNDPCQADGHTGNTSVNIVDSAMDFITRARTGRFYANVWLHVSHNKLDPTAAQKAAVARHSTQCKVGELATNQTECAQLIFVAAQQDADAQIGRLWAHLGDMDLHESTLFLFSTDNGPEEQRIYSNAQGSQGPFRGRKRSLYEGGTRVPSFAVWGGGTPRPTVVSGAIDHTPVSALDWFPTVLSLAMVPWPKELDLDGEDISEILLDQRAGVRFPRRRTTLLFWEWRYGVSGPCENVAPHIAVRDGDWKYLENADGTRQELYKLDLYNSSEGNSALDWHEMTNLRSAEPARAQQMAEALRSWLASLPEGPSWSSNPGCQGFVFPTGSLNSMVAAKQAEGVSMGAHDSDPDW